MALFNNRDNSPIFYYVYCHITYADFVEDYLRAHFPTVVNLNISATNGAGFKIMTYDVGEVNALDVFLEQYEGWIQTQRRNEFNELQVDLMDLDTYHPGCNQRVSFVNGVESAKNLWWMKYNVNANRHKVALRNLALINNSGSTGTYSIMMGDVNKSASIPDGAAIDNNQVLKKNLGYSTDTLDISLTNCDMSGYIVDYEEYAFRDMRDQDSTIINFSAWQDHVLTTRSDTPLTTTSQTHYLVTPGELHKEPAIDYDYINIVCAAQNAAAETDNFRLTIYGMKYPSYSIGYVGEQIFEEYFYIQTSTSLQEDNFRRIYIDREFMTENQYNRLAFVIATELAGTKFLVWDFFLSR